MGRWGKFERRGNFEGAKSVEGGSVLAIWYFQLPNFILAALMYTLLGRALLALIVGPDSSNYIGVSSAALPTRSWR